MYSQRVWGRKKPLRVYDVLRVNLCSTTIRCLCVWVLLVMIWNYFSVIWIMEVRIKIPNHLSYVDTDNISKHIILKADDKLLDSPRADVGLVAHIGYKLGKKIKTRSDWFESRNATKRPKFCRGCFDINFRYLIENEVCSEKIGGNESVSTVMLVFTKHGNNIQRRALRNTWLSAANDTIRYIFVLGKSKKDSDNDLIRKENKNYGDILLIDFIDSYSNLTYKTVSALKWAVSSCSQVRYIMKVDDDMWVNMRKLLQMTKENVFRGMLSGNCDFQSRPFRDPSSKYYVSYSEYSDDVYPPFCSGTGYVVDIEIAKAIVKVSKNIPFFPLEDIYIAFCMQDIRGKIQSMRQFHSWKVFPSPCLYRSDLVLTSHGVSPLELQRVWSTACRQFVGSPWTGLSRGLGAGPVEPRGRKRLGNVRNRYMQNRIRVQNPRYVAVVNKNIKRGSLRSLH